MQLSGLLLASLCLSIEIVKLPLTDFDVNMQKLTEIKEGVTEGIHKKRSGNNFLQAGRTIDKSDVETIFEAVRNISKTNVENTVTTITNTIQGYIDDMHDCADTLGYVDANPAKAEYDNLNSATSTATQLIGAFDQTNTTECADVVAKCSKRDTEGLALYNLMVGSAACGMAQPAGPDVTFDDNFPFPNADTFADNMENAHTAWETAVGECETEETNCNKASADLNEARTNETNACAAEEAKKVSGKQAYDQCFSTKSGELSGYTYSGQITPVQDAILALETLICYIGTAIDVLIDTDDTANALPNSNVVCEFADYEPQSTATTTTAPYVPGGTDGGDSEAPEPINVPGQGELECTCKVDDEVKYTETYDFKIDAKQAPAKDTSWESLGCDATDGALDTTEAPATTSTEAPGPCSPELIKGNFECESGQDRLSMSVEDEQECNELCRAEPGCKGFLVGSSIRRGWCLGQHYDKESDCPTPKTSFFWDFYALC